MVLRYSQCTVVLAALYSTLEGECGNSALVGECTGKRSDSADVDHFDFALSTKILEYICLNSFW